MPKFIVDSIDSAGASITGQDAAHIHRVLRMKSGDCIDITDACGHDYRAVIRSADVSRVDLDIVDKIPVTRESCLKLTLCQGMLKDKKMDELLRHAVELGITDFYPFFCDRSVPVPGAKSMASRVSRWRTIAREALKQSLRSRVPDIHQPVAFSGIVTNSKADLKLIFFEEIRDAMVHISSIPAANHDHVMVLIGPEGGFTREEVTLAEKNRFVTCTMGPRILRAQTAAIAACTLVQTFFGDM